MMLFTESQYHTDGAYIANSKKFHSKVEAILSLPPNNYDVKWDFHDDFFSRYDWFKEPTLSLDQLYAERAKQLRDKYDHIVLNYSGGSDSHNILQTFVKNNIVIDEIQMFGAFDREKKLFEEETPTLDDLRFKNLELYAQAIPFVNELKKKWPNLVLTKFDWSTLLPKVYAESKNFEWIYVPGNGRFAPNLAAKMFVHRSRREAVSSEYKKKKVVYLWGMDKPRVMNQHNKWYIYFVDSVLNNNGGFSDNEVDEYFYWAPESADILCKQAHVIKKYVEADAVRSQFFSKISHKNMPTEEYYEVIKPAIYPTTYQPERFQFDKVTNLLSAREWWFYNSDRPKGYEEWEDGLRMLGNDIDSYWLKKNDIKNGFVGCVSKFHQFA